MGKRDLKLEESFNLLVQLARANKLTWAEHQRVTDAINTVLSALNSDSTIVEKRPVDEPSPEKEE